MKRLAIVVLVGAMLSGCLESSAKSEAVSKEEKAIESIAVSSNTPDMAIKSWWSLKDANLRLSKALCFDNSKARAEVFTKLRSLAGRDIAVEQDCNLMSETYSRSIESVDIQSETMAIVTATIRNTTPPDDGAPFGSEEKAAKEKGSIYKYTLERSDAKSGWVIGKMSRKPYYSSSWDDVLNAPEPYNHKYVNDGNQ